MLRENSGSLVMDLPHAFSRQLKLKAGVPLDVELRGDRLVASRQDEGSRRNPYHYTLAELLADGDYSQPLSDEDREWLDFPAVGREWV